MIKLDDDKSMLFLLCKNWEHKEVPKLKNENHMDYIQRVCNYRCFGNANSEYKSDVLCIYSGLAEKFLSPREFMNAITKINDTLFYTTTPTEAIISALTFVRVKDGDKKLIEFDYSLLKTPEMFKDMVNENTNM